MTLLETIWTDRHKSLEEHRLFCYCKFYNVDIAPVETFLFTNNLPGFDINRSIDTSIVGVTETYSYI